MTRIKRVLAYALCLSMLLGNVAYAQTEEDAEVVETDNTDSELDSGEGAEDIKNLPYDLVMKCECDILWVEEMMRITISAENALYYEIFVENTETEENIFYLKTDQAGTYEWYMEKEGRYTIYFTATNENGSAECARYYIHTVEPRGEWFTFGDKRKYYIERHGYVCNRILRIDGEYYKFDAEGYVITGWDYVDGVWYYYQPSGAMSTGWVTVNGARYYMNKSGAMQTGWQYIDGLWYYMDKSGAMQRGWFLENGTWYYLTSSGAMATGWAAVNGTWYYFNGSGVMQTGWQLVDGLWYYMNSSGAMLRGWFLENGIWYYLTESGAMATGWADVNGTWYYFNSSGAMQTGWLYLDETWYYLNSSGAMQVGWIQQNGYWYYLTNSGAMATGWTYVDGYKYYFHESGEMDTDLRDVVSGPYALKVNRAQNCVTVYGKDAINGYTIPVAAFLCSTGGSNTPLGTFTMSTQYRWHQLYGAVGQYCSRITGHVLFHSVPYFRWGDIYSLMPGQYNKLGSVASAGCVRLSTGDAKWIYDNCETGVTQITIYDGAVASPLEKPILVKIPHYQNWDPTDPAITGQ